MDRVSSTRALTLVETVIATFLLGSALVLVVTLFHRSIRLANLNERVSRASLLARSVLAEIKAEAELPASYSSGLASWAGRVYSLPEYPDLQIKTSVGPAEKLFSPCSGLANRFPNPHELEQVYLPVKIVVSWGAAQEQSIQLLDRIREPVRTLDTIRVTRVDSVGSPVPVDGIMEFRAEALDSGGNVIPGIGFAWSVEPITGNATMLERDSSDSGLSRFQHKYYFNPLTSTWENVPGGIKVRARAVYYGNYYFGESSEIQLQ